jgi:hypothetical protein
LEQLNNEYPEEVKCIAYLEKAMSIKASAHKKIVQEKQNYADIVNSTFNSDIKVQGVPLSEI